MYSSTAILLLTTSIFVVHNLGPAEPGAVNSWEFTAASVAEQFANESPFFGLIRGQIQGSPAPAPVVAVQAVLAVPVLKGGILVVNQTGFLVVINGGIDDGLNVVNIKGPVGLPVVIMGGTDDGLLVVNIRGGPVGLPVVIIWFGLLVVNTDIVPGFLVVTIFGLAGLFVVKNKGGTGRPVVVMKKGLCEEDTGRFADVMVDGWADVGTIKGAIDGGA